MDTLLHTGLEKIGLTGRPELEQILESYVTELRLFNSAYDLINTDDHDEIIVRHILDSLSAVPVLADYIAAHRSPDFVIADIGSGSGLPGIPLAAVFPEIRFILVERMTKRCSFLTNCVAVLNLKNVTIENNQAERLAQNRFDVAVFRAFRPLDRKMIHVLLRILKTGGILAAYKAKKEKITAEMCAIGADVPDYDVIPLTVPFLTEQTAPGEERERNLVVIKKGPPRT
jgi:16S rRNA (guanine527-N7)-methyltransferase